MCSPYVVRLFYVNPDNPGITMNALLVLRYDFTGKVIGVSESPLCQAQFNDWTCGQRGLIRSRTLCSFQEGAT